MKLNNLTEAQAALAPYIPLAAQLTGKNITLERMWPLLKAVGNPHESLRVVHVAGTSGKTSTAYYTAALLAATGKRVGLSVSPHIDSITERIQINGQAMSEAEFCGELGEFLDIVQATNLQPSHFELLQAFTFWVFARKQVEYAVVETGMGGLHDASNVTQRADKVCVITDIGLDHMDILGTTITAIAGQKAGIIHQGNHVIMHQQPAAVMKVVKQHVKRAQGSVQLAKDADTFTPELPTYQQRNWSLAFAVYEYLAQRDSLQRLTRQVLLKTQRIAIPGRMETRHIGNKVVIIDGAHNSQKMTAFLKAFRAKYPHAKAAVLIGMKESNDYKEAVDLLAPIAQRAITVAFAATQDLPVRSIAPHLLAEAFVQKQIPARAYDSQSAAIDDLLLGSERLCIITGSFYLLGQLRAQLPPT